MIPHLAVHFEHHVTSTLTPCESVLPYGQCMSQVWREIQTALASPSGSAAVRVRGPSAHLPASLSDVSTYESFSRRCPQAVPARHHFGREAVLSTHCTASDATPYDRGSVPDAQLGSGTFSLPFSCTKG